MEVKFTVIGSTSPTGLQILEQGIKRGHEITAFTRRPQLLEKKVIGLKQVVTGDGLNLFDVKKAIRKQDAVIAIVGVRGLGRTTVATDVTRILLKAMQEEEIQRLVCVSSYLAGPATGQPARFFKWLMRRPLADRLSADQLVMSTSLDWTIVRPGRLLDKPATGRVRQQRDWKEFEFSPVMIGRADLASVLLDIVENKDVGGSVINVSWEKK
jgi:putative NADH-flavin reductase